MATTNELRGIDYQHVAYALVIEGSPSIFVTHEDLQGRAQTTGTWLYTDRAHYSASVTASLMIPDSLPLGIDPREGIINDESTSFTLSDIDGQLVSLFRAVNNGDNDMLRTSIFPNTTPSSAQTLAGSGVLGRHVGIEYIGLNGERRLNPAFISGSQCLRTGLFHPGEDFVDSTLPKARVSDVPLEWQGRRVGLYRVFRDVLLHPTGSSPAAASWRPLNESPLIWWGTFADIGEVNGGTMTVECDGPNSLLKKQLNAWSTTQARTIIPSASFTSDELKIGGRLTVTIGYYNQDEGVLKIFPGTELLYRNKTLSTIPFTEQFTLDSSPTIEDLRLEIENTLLELSSDSANDALTSLNDWDATYGPGFNPTVRTAQPFGIRCQINVAPPVKADTGVDTDIHHVRVQLWLHKKVWSFLGFNVDEQSKLDNDDEYYVQFEKSNKILDLGMVGAEGGEAPADDYYVGTFSTSAPGFANYLSSIESAGGDAAWDGCNSGVPRTWKPAYEDGTIFLDPNGNQMIKIGTTNTEGIDNDRYLCAGQLFRPPFGDANDGYDTAFNIPGIGDVDSTRLFVFHGKRRKEGSDNIVDEFQVAKCSWKESTSNPGLVATDDLDYPVLVIEEWLAPEKFGFPSKKLESAWVGLGPGAATENRIKITPLGAWKYNKEPRDQIQAVIQRMLLSTGTSTGWTTFEGSGENTRDAGDNTRAIDLGADLFTTGDAETADMGLAIPTHMVAPAYIWKQESDKIPHPMRLGRLVTVGKTQAHDVLAEMMKTRGWSWRLHNAQYGPFCIFDFVTPGDAEVVLTEEDIVGDPENPAANWPQQSTRVLNAIDTVELEYHFEPLNEEFRQELSIDSEDAGRLYRTREVTESLSDRSLKGFEGAKTHVSKLWQKACKFWANRNFSVSYNVHQRIGEKLWPGTRVLLTDTRLISQNGTRNVSSYTGVVLNVVRMPRERYDNVTLLIFAENAEPSAKIFAPLGRPTAYDPVTLRLFLDDNFLRIPNTVDATLFIEPEWSSYGSASYITVYERERRVNSTGDHTFTSLGSAAVVSASISAGNCYLTLGSALSSWNRDTDKFVTFAPPGTQIEGGWVRRLHAPIGDEFGRDSEGALVPTFM